jgi:hypothetical protein
MSMEDTKTMDSTLGLGQSSLEQGFYHILNKCNKFITKCLWQLTNHELSYRS